MINGLKNKEVVYSIFSDGRPHFSREFVNTGLLEYRRRITDLRLEGYVIEPLKIEGRPAYQLKKEVKTDLFV